MARIARHSASGVVRSVRSCFKVMTFLLILLTMLLIRIIHQRRATSPPTGFQRSYSCGYESRSSLSSSVSSENSTIASATGQYVSVCSRTFDTRRMGNHLFNFAAMLKAASLTGRQVAMVRKYPYGSWVEGVFNISIKRVDSIDQLCPCADVTESLPLAYSWSLPAMMTNPTTIDGKSLLICGWNQSWKYLIGIEDQLIRHLQPHSHLCEEVRRYFERIRPPSWNRNSYLRVGIHIRTGDTANGRELHRGYTIPQLPFFERAVDYIVENGTSLLPVKSGDKRKIQLIVATDDFRWTYANLNLSSMVNKWNNSAVDINLTYSLGNNAAFDLIMLSKCDVVVMTTGTYGWWAAWLANRKMTIYYRRWPREGSELDRKFVREDFFPPDWIPIDGPFFTF